jgi:hypothetical protein
MDPQLYNLIEPAVVFATLFGVAFGVKLLVWGKGPIKQVRRGAPDPALEQRLVRLEERWEQVSELIVDQAQKLEEHDERLDFTERMLTRQRSEDVKALAKPEESTPV